ncbi:hypothetical protein D5S17_16155 [Pseudonocardiaceae bacterium YIM PH 21723]|nr:hypothetical protein D5S17_16155 [Pseudonocardiaceae bacterium YIM PH 21723]
MRTIRVTGRRRTSTTTRVVLACCLATALTGSVLLTADARDDDSPLSWQEDPAAISWQQGDLGAGTRTGTQLITGILPEHQLPESVGSVTITAEASPDAELAVRALSPRGWTEWAPAPAGRSTTLPKPGTSVQIRVAASGVKPEKPQLRSLRVTGTRATAIPRGEQAATRSYEVFATREGLVGGITGNGHRIQDRDHFVALPSWRSLSKKNSGDYSVQICAKNGRCAWAPVWDVGPWNTKDDYWNPAGTRQMWQDLAQGLPQSQAAKQQAYNGGKDQFGRSVANPAGIDLADGTFWDGLGLKDNSWVTVSYLWDTDIWSGRITTDPDEHGNNQPTAVRSGPGIANPIVGMAGRFAKVPAYCELPGPTVVDGPQGATDRWVRIGKDQYVSRALVKPAQSLPTCSP